MNFRYTASRGSDFYLTKALIELAQQLSEVTLMVKVVTKLMELYDKLTLTTRGNESITERVPRVVGLREITGVSF